MDSDVSSGKGNSGEKEYNLCGETISGAKLKEAICAVQDDLIDKN